MSAHLGRSFQALESYMNDTYLDRFCAEGYSCPLHALTAAQQTSLQARRSLRIEHGPGNLTSRSCCCFGAIDSRLARCHASRLIP